MMNIDLITMVGNLSQSLPSVQHLLMGLSYLLGLLFFYHALAKLKKIGDARASSGAHDKIFVPLAYFFIGSILIFLPSAINVFSNSVFGAGNILQYAAYSPYDIYNSMGLLIQTIGLIWFIRGSVLLAHVSEAGGVKQGKKGLMFLFAGILAINFYSTVSFLNTSINYLEQLTTNKGTTS